MKTALTILVSSITFGAVSCNAILSNEPGVIAVTEEAGTEPPFVQPVTDDDRAIPASPPAVTQDAGLSCPPGQQACGGACVSETDLRYGCGDASCTKGHADCNQKPEDGCEADLTNDRTNCGACRHVCAAGSKCKNRSCRPARDR